MATQTTEQPDTGSDERSSEERLGDLLLGTEEPNEETEAAASEAVEDEDGQPEIQAIEDLEDVDFNGKQYKLPKELKSALMAQSDYTKKTQDLSSLRGMIDAKVVMTQQEQQFHTQVAPEMQELSQLEAEISRFGKIDWQQLDTDTLVRTRHALDQLKDRRLEVRGEIEKKRTVFQGQLQQFSAQALAKGLEYLNRNIPNWNDATQKDVVDYGTKRGYSEVKLRSMDDPLDVETLWKAMQWDQLQSQKPGAKNKAQTAPPVKPGASTSQQQANSLESARFAKAMKSAKSQGQKINLAQDRLGRILTGG